MAPTWVPAVKSVVQPIAGALPALVLVIFAGLLGLIALACEPDRRRFALAYADRFTTLAAVLVGGHRPGPQRWSDPADSIAARPASRRAIGTRNGEQDT